jgi:biotin carboxyl carrier protein
MSDIKNLKSFRIGDTIYTTKTTKKFDNRKVWEYPDPNKIVSYIPGTVVSIEAKVGEPLKEGDTIIIFEAMKMQTRIGMPYDGEVTKFHVGVGDKYPKEFVLAEIK